MGQILESYTEFVLNEAKIKPKDFKRMVDLELKGDDGESVAKKLTKKDKAINRFIIGTKLHREEINYKESYKRYRNFFSDFGNKALELGASIEEIQSAFDALEIPEEYLTQIAQSKGKKLDNGFVRDISKAVLKAGYDIEYLKTNGNAITGEGRDVMRNGRKWTIGYRTVITIGDRKENLVFDAVTDEGGSTTKYINSYESSSMFSNVPRWIVGGRLFVKELAKSLEKVQSTNESKSHPSDGVEDLIDAKEASKELKQMSSELLSSSEFDEYIEDYYNNPAEYDIDVKGTYYQAIVSAYEESSPKFYKEYKKQF